MFCKIALISCFLAAAHAGEYYAPAPYAHSAVGTQSQSVVRSLDGSSVHSVYSKAVDTPFSSVRKYDSRHSNDAVAYAHAPVYHAPLAYSAPVVKSYAAAPVGYALKSYAAPYPYAGVKSYAYAPHAVAYSAPVAYHAAPYAAVKAPVAYHGASLPYSSAAVVSHVDFDGYGVHYAF